MKLNKYLKELGLTWYDLPGNYVSKLPNKDKIKRKIQQIKNGIKYIFSPIETHPADIVDNWRWDAPAFDIRNKENNEGFCSYEFFSLDYSLALYIYPRLCYFRDHIATMATPSYLCYDEEGNHIENGNERWVDILDRMILGFKYIIKQPDWKETEELEEINKVITEGLELFAKHYSSLWY